MKKEKMCEEHYKMYPENRCGFCVLDTTKWAQWNFASILKEPYYDDINRHIQEHVECINASENTTKRKV